MSKILYPIFKLPDENDEEKEPVPTWIKWWMINNYKKRNWILSEIITGNPLTLENSVETKFYLPPLPRGNSKQVQYSGKNLAKVSGDSMTLFQNLVVNKNGNDITISGTATGDVASGKAFSIDGNSHTNDATYLTNANTFTLKAGTYTLSINNISGSYSGINRFDIVLLKKKENAPYTVLKLFSLPTTKDTVTISEDSEECFIGISISYTQETAITFSNYKFNIMLASGTDDTYEPYVGGTASPNPSYPQAISNVTGDVEVLVQNKNLINLSNEQFNVYKEYQNLNIPAGTYTFSSKITSSDTDSSVCRVYFYGADVSPVFINLDRNIRSSVTVTLNGTYNRIILYASYDYAHSTGDAAVYENCQLEKGTTATTYTPHQEQTLPLTLGNIELCKIGTAQDYFFKENNKWYLYKAVGKIVLDGTEDWTNSGSMTSENYYGAYTSKHFGGPTGTFIDASKFMTNYFQSNSTITGDYAFIASSGYASYLKIANNLANSVSDLKTWLSSHNTEVYYLLATPTTTEITDTTLISQLEAISTALSYNEQTNISGSSDEAEPLFEVQYYMTNESEGE